ncbi:MAG TPA: MBL fold metallo-hydrolase [Baekduia sp.]|uniref:MBL fold metallo-hydrolase n=1 Tax=Baekduia sp. TaxID=2600305 RepID=UPI002D76F1B4|nr:MBL fold metallo-hydrolase [Baekduia sp.]HET6507040.1 MBL fold metallo-hydrolase [Baekduia sp.]
MPSRAPHPPPVPAPVPLDARLVAPGPPRPGAERADRLADGLWVLRLPLRYPTTSAINCFLLADARGGGWTLVDSGSGLDGGWEALRGALRLAGVEPAAVGTLVLTHPHPDHSTLAAELVDRLGCRVVRHAGPTSTMDRLRDPRLPLARREAAARREGVGEDELEVLTDVPIAGDGRQPRPAADHVLHPGDALASASGTWHAVPVPGHSPSQMALYEPTRRWLIAADAAYAGVRPYLEWGTSATPLADYRASLARVRALAPELLLPGHGRPDRDPAARLAGAEATLAETVAWVRGALTEEPRTAYALTCALAGDEPNPDERGSVLSVALCVLEELVGRHEAAQEIGADGRRRFARA